MAIPKLNPVEPEMKQRRKIKMMVQDRQGTHWIIDIPGTKDKQIIEIARR